MSVSGIVAGARVRAMEEGDVEGVAKLEAATFTTPWKATTFRTLLDRPGAILLVLEVPPHDIAGYAVLWCILDQGELANIAVIPELRGRGLGSWVLEHVLEVAAARGVQSLYLEVRDSNALARSMYRTHGFQEIGVRRDYYDKPREDARVLMKRLVATP
jgi:ribosomal-protein-alanine N-acetyltransferase